MFFEGKIEYHVPCGTGALVRERRVLKCSVCGEIMEFNEYGVRPGTYKPTHISEVKYCPNCGAKGDE